MIRRSLYWSFWLILLAAASWATEVRVPYRSAEAHIESAMQSLRELPPKTVTRIEFHDAVRVTKVGKRHGRWHRFGWYGQAADAATTTYALCVAEGYHEANPFLAIFGDDCGDVLLVMVPVKVGLLWFGEWNEKRERRKHGCEESLCPPQLYRHLSINWGVLGALGAVPAAWNTYQLVTEDKRDE
jgi:hypothetical protein